MRLGAANWGCMANQPDDNPVFCGVDIGAGSGAKIGLFDSRLKSCSAGMVPVADYGGSGPAMALILADEIQRLQKSAPCCGRHLAGVGIAAPGLFLSDGTFRLVNNLPFLANVNLCRMLREKLGVPVAGINDADAGGLAEWSSVGHALLYWVLGGGWGGTWISEGGEIMFPALDWDGRDDSLHPANEPGYAIGLDKGDLDRLFKDFGVSFDIWRSVCARYEPDLSLSGPGGSQSQVRAELLISGPGRWRLFAMLRHLHPDGLAALAPEKLKLLESHATAGPVLDEIGRIGLPAAKATNALFARIWAMAAAVLFNRAEKDGCPRNIPVLLGGKPNRAFPSFKDDFLRELRRFGIESEVRISDLESQGQNANLIGAASLAERIAR